MMLVECSAVTVVILLMMYVFYRRGNKGFVLPVLPLLFVPVAHLAVYGALKLLPEDRRSSILIVADLVALVCACLAFGFFSNRIKSKRYRSVYMILCAGFSVIFTCVLIFNNISLYR